MFYRAFESIVSDDRRGKARSRTRGTGHFHLPGFLKASVSLLLATLMLISPAYRRNRAHAQDDFNAQAAGDLDPTFGTGGRVTTDFFGGDDSCQAVAVQSDGKIIAAGYAEHPGTSIDFALARYNNDGSLDPSFGAGGKVVTDFFGRNDVGLAMLIQADGKIIVAGTVVKSDVDRDFGLARYNANGSLDPTFGTGGKVTIDFFGLGDTAKAVALQSDGKIIAAGFATSPSAGRQPALTRLNTNGTLDTTFGRIVLSFAGSGVSAAEAEQSRIRPSQGAPAFTGGANGIGIVPEGLTELTGDVMLAVTLNDRNGNGTAGVIAFDLNNVRLVTGFRGGFASLPSSVQDAEAVLFLNEPANPSLLVAGTSNNPPLGLKFAAVKLLPSGDRDNSFGTGGVATVDFASMEDPIARDANLTWSIAFGFSYLGGARRNRNGGFDFGVASLDFKGNPNSAFGQKGRVIIPFASGDAVAQAAAFQQDFKLIIAGLVFTGPNTTDFALARLLAGTQQPDFALGFDQPTVTVQAGTKARVTVQILRIGAFIGAVTVTPPGPSGGIRAKPADPITTTDSSATFKLKIGGGVATGGYDLTFTGKDDTGRTRTATVTLVVQ